MCNFQQLSDVLCRGLSVSPLLTGMQYLRSQDSAEVRALVQALAGKIVASPHPMDAKGIGSALYGKSGSDSTA